MECVVDALYELIISERKDGKSIAEIAKKLHTTQVRVQRVLITDAGHLYSGQTCLNV